MPIHACFALPYALFLVNGCSELFNYDNGEEWGVGHYLFQKK